MPKQKGIFALLSKTEQQHLKKINKRYAQEIANYAECFDLLNDVMWQIRDAKLENKEDFRLSDVTIFAVCNRIIGTSKVYLDLQIKGFKFDANIIMRSLIESMSLLDWLLKDEKNAERWMHGNVKFKHIRKELKELCSQEAFSRAYSAFSDYVHSNFKALKDLFELSETREILDEKGSVRRMTNLIIEPDPEKFELEEDALYPSAGISAILSLKKKYSPLLKPEIKYRIDDMFEKMNGQKHNS